MSQLIPWLQITLAGSVYLLAIIFFLLILVKWAGFNPKNFNHKDYSHYISVLAVVFVFASFIIGFTAYLVSEKIIFSLTSETFKISGIKNY